MFNFDLISMVVGGFPVSLAMYYFDVMPSSSENPLTMMTNPYALLNKAMIGAKRLDIVQIALIIWSFLLPKTVAFSPLIHAILWPTVILCGVWILAVVLYCLLIAVLSAANHLLGSNRYEVTEDEGGAAILLVLGYAALAVVFVGCVLAESMSVIGCIAPFLFGVGLEALGKLSYLAIFVLGAAIHRFCIKPNSGMFVVADRWLPLSAENNCVKTFPRDLQAQMQGFLDRSEHEMQPLSSI